MADTEASLSGNYKVRCIVRASCDIKKEQRSDVGYPNLRQSAYFRAIPEEAVPLNEAKTLCEKKAKEFLKQFVAQNSNVCANSGRASVLYTKPVRLSNPEAKFHSTMSQIRKLEGELRDELENKERLTKVVEQILQQRGSFLRLNRMSKRLLITMRSIARIGNQLGVLTEKTLQLRPLFKPKSQVKVSCPQWRRFCYFKKEYTEGGQYIDRDNVVEFRDDNSPSREVVNILCNPNNLKKPSAKPGRAKMHVYWAFGLSKIGETESGPKFDRCHQYKIVSGGRASIASSDIPEKKEKMTTKLMRYYRMTTPHIVSFAKYLKITRAWSQFKNWIGRFLPKKNKPTINSGRI